jgi:hypothetical protein
MYFEGITKYVEGISMYINVFQFTVCRLARMCTLAQKECNSKLGKMNKLSQTLSGRHCCHLLSKSITYQLLLFSSIIDIT